MANALSLDSAVGLLWEFEGKTLFFSYLNVHAVICAFVCLSFLLLSQVSGEPTAVTMFTIQHKSSI
jgi:hypothetical protein